MKKLFALILAIAVFLSLFTGCSTTGIRQRQSEYNASRYDESTETYDFDQFLTTERQHPSDEEVESCLQEAEAAFANGNDYASAIRVITTAQNTLGEDERLTAALEEYQSYIPVYLNELDYFDGSPFYCVQYRDNETDNYGNTYKYALWITQEEGARFYLAGNYSTLTGTCAMHDRQRNTSASGYIEIYGDEVLLYTSPTMVSDSQPQDFSIDISNVTFLRIATHGIGSYSGMKPPMLCNAILQK